MIIIKHRRNTIAELRDTPLSYGVEIDIRSIGNELVLHHDPYVIGDKLQEWLKSYRHRFLILNVKEEGLEDRLMEMMNRYTITEYFFLDQSFPFLIRTSRKGESRCAVRVSEYESLETALKLAGMVGWVWVDCFSRFPLLSSEVDKLKGSGFKLCLVSPELQGRDGYSEIKNLRKYLCDNNISADAVCTKMPELWL